VAKSNRADCVQLLQDLLRCKSVTPHEGGALTYLENFLSSHGFVCHRLIFREEGTPDVENLFASLLWRPHRCGAGG
jgi:succinyl-diaminopimelate desuccinylase